MAALTASAMRPNPPQAIRGNAENLFTHRGNGHHLPSRERGRHTGRALWPGGLQPRPTSDQQQTINLSLDDPTLTIKRGLFGIALGIAPSHNDIAKPRFRGPPCRKFHRNNVRSIDKEEINSHLALLCFGSPPKNPPQAIRERAENLFTHRGNGRQLASRERETTEIMR